MILVSRWEMNWKNFLTMTMTWQTFICQGNSLRRLLLSVGLELQIGSLPLLQLAQSYPEQVGPVQQQLMRKMMLRNSKCCWRSDKFNQRSHLAHWESISDTDTFLQAYFMQIDGTLNKLSTVRIVIDILAPVLCFIMLPNKFSYSNLMKISLELSQ